MPSQYAWKWGSLAAAGLLALAGIRVVCHATSGCSISPQPPEDVSVTTTKSGDATMSIANQKQQVHHADQASFRELVLNSDVPVLVDFYADWCGPCQRLAPMLEELAADVPGARIVKINVDESPDLAAEYSVDSIPSLKVFKNGVVTDKIAGLATKGQLRALLAR
jgi:thioredoxin 1